MTTHYYRVYKISYSSSYGLILFAKKKKKTELSRAVFLTWHGAASCEVFARGQILYVLSPQLTMGPYCYLIFCTICLTVALYTIFVIPETRNKTFVEISQMFASMNKISKEELSSNGQLKLSVMNGYGTVGHRGQKQGHGP